MSAAAVVAAKQKQLMRKLTEAGATDPGSARPLTDLGLRRSFVFNRLVKRGVFVEVGGGRYYIDLAEGERFRSRQRRTALLVLALIAVGLLILWAI